MFFISKLLTKTFQQTDPGDEIYNTITLFAAHGRKTVALACKKNPFAAGILECVSDHES